MLPKKNDQRKAIRINFVLHDIRSSIDREKSVHDMLETLLSAAYSSNLNHSNYHSIVSTGHAFTEQNFTCYEDVEVWLHDWLACFKKAQIFLTWYPQIVTFPPPPPPRFFTITNRLLRDAPYSCNHGDGEKEEEERARGWWPQLVCPIPLPMEHWL